MLLDSFYLLKATAAELQASLHTGAITSVQLVQSCLSQIEKLDKHLHAVISCAPLDNVVAIAQKLDQERAIGVVRSALHGVPVLVKDNIATHQSLGMDTTAGSLALAGSHPQRHADVVQRLLDAGAIIIAKANLSEFAWYKSPNASTGWSATGGQTRSPYIPKSTHGDEAVAGDNNPGGSSCGPAVGVAAGYAPVAIGTETNGSLTMPAHRAALYTLKPTVGIVSVSGIVPISKLCDSAGPMAKSAADIAMLMDIIVDKSKTKVPRDKYLDALSCGFEGLQIGTLDAKTWIPKRDYRPSAVSDKMEKEVLGAYAKIRGLCVAFHEMVSLLHLDQLMLDGVLIMPKIFEASFRDEIGEYLDDLELSQVRSLAEIVQFNTDNAERELPPACPDQEFLENALKSELPRREVRNLIDKLREVGQAKGLDRTFKENNINVLVGPGECGLSTFAAAAGYPICTLPLTSLAPSGRPYGLEAVAAAHNDALLIQLMSAWETHFPARIIPTDMANEETWATNYSPTTIG